jgi:hypothetical protein
VGVSLSVISGAAVALVCALPRVASAQPPDPALLERISHHIKTLDVIEKRASVRVEQITEELDGEGKISSTKKQLSHIEADGTSAHEIVDRCTKDGKDVTAEAQEEVKKAEAEQAKEKKKDGKDEGEALTLPFASDGYAYDQIAVDQADPTRVEISFVPKTPTKHTVEGNVWVDTTSGTIISAGAKLSKPPTFVDWVHFTVELGAKTPLGPAMSRLTFEAKAGILFIKKHIRGEVKMTDYRLLP